MPNQAKTDPDSIIRVLVKREGKSASVNAEGVDIIIETDEETKIEIEIERWITAIGYANEYPDKLKDMSPALFDLHRAGDKRALARTVRMLLFFELLFIQHKREKGAKIAGIEVPYSFQKEVTDLMLKCNPLKVAVTKIKKTRVPLEEGTDYISLPLLMVVAIAESQCEHFRPVFWEAYSAGRARNELNQKWQEPPREILDVITLFIRFQSSPGKYARGTGGKRAYAKKITDIAGKTKWTKKSLHDALKVLGVIEEARNHKLPGFGDNAQIGALRVNEGVNWEWEERTWFKVPGEINGLTNQVPDKFKGKIYRKEEHLVKHFKENNLDDRDIKIIVDNSAMIHDRNAEMIFNTKDSRKATWCFAATLDVVEEIMENFKDLVGGNIKRILKKENLELPPEAQIAAFSFSRRQIEEMGDIVAESVKKVLDNNREIAELESSFTENFYEYFHAKLIIVPDCFGGDEPEYVIEILLNDEIAAYYILFREKIEKPPKIGNKAADLFSHLFNKARTEFELESDTIRRKTEQDFYLPFPLLKRILEVVYRLRPDTCLSIPITFDQTRQEIIYIPQHLKKDTDEKAIYCIANYVHAFVLNQAMSRGFHSCDIGLDILEASDEETSDSMTGRDWKEKIESAYRDNGYEILVEKYLRDYNTEREHVELLKNSRSAVDAKTFKETKELLVNHRTPGSGPDEQLNLFLGIDIGGTLTKFQFYKLSKENSGMRYQPIGSDFKMLTPTPEDQYREGDALEFGIRIVSSITGRDKNELIRMLTPDPEETINKSAREFAKRLVNSIVKNKKENEGLEALADKKGRILAVGISWPGPVRGNRVAGTSGILKRFPPLSNIIIENKIEHIMGLNIVEAFKNAWDKNSLGEDVPFVTMVNDGCADGIGAVEYLSTQMEKISDSNEGRLAVVKLGTGTAGAVFENGIMQKGLTEWGKILLDLAAPPQKKFPEGTANLYLSSKTMPGKISSDKDRRKGLFDAEDLDSLEIGRLLEAAAGKFGEKELEKLREECGIRRFARTGLSEKVDVEVLKRVKLKKAEPELFDLIQHHLLILKVIGDAVYKKLEGMVKVHGEVRIHELLGITSQEAKDLFKGKNPPEVRKELQCASNIAERSAQSLGRYLGDFIVLLFDIYGMNTVITSGGVLNGITGEIIRKKAEERIEKYHLHPIFNGRILKLKQRDEKKPLKRNFRNDEKAPDFGTLGAAVYSASEYLLDLKQKGLNRIKVKLMNLLPNESAVLGKDENKKEIIKFDKGKSILLDKYFLSDKEVKKFLDLYGTEFCIYQSGPGEYTRWHTEKRK